jgi:hypothetical protein
MIEITTTEHPRLFINQERISELKQLKKTDPLFVKLENLLIRKANDLLTEDVVPFQITGPRMLKNCQEIHARVETLALCCLLTGDRKYAIRAKDELMSAAGFPHWNKDHFLDTAELITAFAIGYDWLYHELPETDLENIKDAMINKGILPGLEEHKNNIWWAGHKYNWNQVCNGGLIIGALAVADEESQLCNEVFEATVKYLPIAFSSYGKEGGWEGGPDYWQYTTWYSALLIDALQKVTGNDFGLSKTEGFDQTGLFPIYTAGANDKFFNFADADETYKALPTLFWLGKQFNNDVYITENHRLLKKASTDLSGFDAFNLVWYMPAKINVTQLSLNKCFNDINMGSFRSDWANSEATFIAFKGGFNQADHAHLDMGSFVLDMNGERFASDLGRDSYDLPGYFDLSEGGGRWEYFRLNTKSHNTLVLNNDIQRAAAKAPITEMNSASGNTEAKINLTEAYRPHVNGVIRSFTLTNEENVEITDEVVWREGKKHFRWQILTDASIKIQGGKAILTKNNQSVQVEILQPNNLIFKAESATQPQPQMANDGYQLLFLEGDEAGKQTTIQVRINKKIC